MSEFKHKHGQEPAELIAVSRRAGKAIGDFRLIEEGDRIAVAVSGGKDSISLLHVLRHRQKIAPVRFEFIAVHIDFEFADFDSTKLIAYLEREGFPYHIEKVDSMKEERWEDIDCFWWSWNRRKALFEICAKRGFNKIAFGHHLDDIVETIILNQFYRGEIGSMRPRQELFEGKVTIIRPLAYEREEKMAKLALKLNIQSIGGQSKCANDETSHRMKIKQMLRGFEKDNPQIIRNIFNSLQNIKTEYLLEKSPVEFHPILEYWFGTLDDRAIIDKNSPLVRKWFSGGKAVDDEIRVKFEYDLKRAKEGKYQSWETLAEGRLALVILFDQFSRNVYRNTPMMFAADPLALSLTLRSIDEKMDKALSLVGRIFLYMPLMHAEDLEKQKLSLKCFAELVAEAKQKSPQNTGYYEYSLEFARCHHDIIERFGRFPHRNEILNRPSTTEELEFLKKPGSKF